MVHKPSGTESIRYVCLCVEVLRPREGERTIEREREMEVEISVVVYMRDEGFQCEIVNSAALLI